ncbi:pyrroline-5-carboxylate reductase family protein [Pseudomonas sp.]|uniref:pyrroline-5-carboxylate reductase family protein n=1 Tax=Pseudomonas sp. TaxID=306 RepID=UPI003D0EFAA0
MSIRSRVGIIGGTGWLGRSIAQALVDSGFTAPGALTLSNRTGVWAQAPASLAEVAITASNQALVDTSDVIILSVRPEDLNALRLDASGKLLISLVAGAALSDLQAHTGCRRIVRAMPNAALEIRRSHTPWLASAEVEQQDRAYVQALFDTCGQADEVFSEAHLNYLTGLVGTGPSYPALLAQALFENALAQGLPEAVARRAAAGVVVHASQLITEQRGFDELLDALIGYRGVSSAGIQGMRDAGLERCVNAGLDAAMKVAESQLFQPD